MTDMNLRFRLLLTACLLIICSVVKAQSVKLFGKVLNEKNEPLASVTVKIVGGGATTTDVEGRFSLSLTPGKKYELDVTAIGYTEKHLSEVEVFSSQANELNIILEIKATAGANVTVSASRGSARRESAAALIAFQKNTNTVASVISAEAIRRSPDKNTGEVLKRTPGASIQEGRFIVIRGLADRYNQAMLNGILLTSTEPDRKTFSFDLIPAQMIDNIVINKAFVPEYPGEWAGGLIQVNTKDIPTKGFFNIQVGTGVNSQTVGKDFYKDKGGKLDWLGIEDGTRALPPGYTSKYEFGMLDPAQKSAIGKSMRNTWTADKTSAPINASFQVNGGFTGKVFGKTIGGNVGIIYNKTNRYLQLVNRRNVISGNNLTIETDFDDDRYSQEVSAGALASLTMQFNPLNKISAKALINVNTTNYVTNRDGVDISRPDQFLKGSEFRFKQNTFFTTQLSGEHSLAKQLKFKWYGAFNILDGYIPDQRRLLYSRASVTDPYRAVIANSLSQQSGSRIYQSLSDYIYTAGGDLTYTFDWLGQKQSLKGGYMLQIKDRLYDAILFANYLPRDNDALRQLPADQIFAPGNFGDGSATSTQLAFNAIIDRTYRYMANTILNGGFLQMDNQFTKDLRVVWGLRVENYDQLVGSVKKWDPRHTYSKVTDFLPGVNATLKLNAKTNIRLSGSQTVVRPELRELANLNLYDFELNASVQGNPKLERTKVINADFRYELYPRTGEVLTAGIFYKHFDKPIEQLLNEGGGGASTFTFQNPETATSYGAEVELRKRLDFMPGFKNFTFQANVAYIHSRVKDQNFDLDRPLQGQSPYVLNIGLLYDHEKSGFSSTLLFNQVGERIYLVGDKSAGAGTPDTYEAPRSVLDLQLAKKLIRNKAEIRLNVSDLLNTTQYFYQNIGDKTTFKKSTDAYRFTRKAGTTFSVTFNYSL
jgi:outer membrane receptor protein involved in Fe transport